MNSRPSSWQRLFVGCAALFLFAGWAVMAQQPDGGKPKTEIPKAGVGGVSTPTCEYCPNPDYPQEAQEKKKYVVVLVVVVTSEGKATNIQVIKSPGLGFDEKAIEAVRSWKFKPAMKNGKPVATKVPIEVTFRLFPPKN